MRPLLGRGDVVGVVAPGFAVPPAPLRAGLCALRGMGFAVRPGEHLAAREGYLAGDDARRLSDLNRMIRDPAVRGIWFARGGYGTARLLPGIDWRALRRDPKVLVGYSDLTALFAAAIRRAGCPCLYGPVVAELGRAAAYHRPSLRAALRGEEVRLSVARRGVLAPGRCSGPLLGGNLSVLTRLLGTPFAPDLRGSVLFLEDVGEETYRLDRMLHHLSSSGALAGVRGVLVGSFEPATSRRRFPPERRVADLLRETFLPLRVPVVTGLPAGHRPAKRTLPLGGPARVDTAGGTVRIRAAAGSRRS